MVTGFVADAEEGFNTHGHSTHHTETSASVCVGDNVHMSGPLGPI